MHLHVRQYLVLSILGRCKTRTILRCTGWRLLLGITAGCFWANNLPAMPGQLKVLGNQMVDGSGKPVRLRGVNCAGLEWTSDGDGHILKTVEVAVVGWHANLIRLPLTQDRWFGKAPGQKGDASSYRTLVRQLVDFCAAHNVYLILDLHWSDAGEWGKNIGQHNLPDRNSIAFWQDVATAFNAHPSACSISTTNRRTAPGISGSRVGWSQSARLEYSG